MNTLWSEWMLCSGVAAEEPVVYCREWIESVQEKQATRPFLVLRSSKILKTKVKQPGAAGQILTRNQTCARHICLYCSLFI